MMNILLISLWVILSTIAQPLMAAEGKVAFSSHDWQVIIQKEKKQKTCYLYSRPTKSSGTFKKRGDAYVFLNALGHKQFEFSASSGYPYKEGKDGAVQVLVGKASFKTVTKDEVLWLNGKEDDETIIKTMMKQNQMHVLGTSRANTTSDDTYSLQGFIATFQWMLRECK